MKVKRIILCADDYGLLPEIDQGILDLLAQQRLTAVSCLVTSEHWLNASQKLTSFQNLVNIGLHLNLTEGNLLILDQSFSLKNLIIKAALRILPFKSIYDEISAQYTQFCNTMGRQPDFIDGHQHIHHLPIIREALLQFIEDYRLNAMYIRNSKSRQFFGKFGFKKALITYSGGRKFASLLKAHKIAHNSSFAGCYDFKTKLPYQQLFLTFLEDSEDQGLIMCHPGLESKRDGLAKSRKKEYNYFISQQFLCDLDQCQVQLTKIR